MLRIHQTKSAAAAKSYYQSGLVAEGYYAKEGEGVWFGEGAKRLGLNGTVKQDDFNLLCDNLRPDTRGRLNPRKDRDRRVGYDFTFAAPKSVSLMLEVIGDQRILTVFRDAVRSTMAMIENEVLVRVRRGGVTDVRQSAGMLYAEFVHHTTRPISIPGTQAVTVDPALHCHCYAINSAFDPIEQLFKAADFSRVKQDAPYFEAIFHSKLAIGLSKLGYGIEVKKFGFEIKGLGEENLRLFSQRTAEIEALADQMSIGSNATAKAQLGARSRKKKLKGIRQADVLREWRQRIIRSDLTYNRHPAGNPFSSSEKGLTYALQNCFERCSVVPFRRLVGEALKASLGACSLESILAEVHNRSDLLIGEVIGRKYCTTKEVLSEERDVLAFLESTRGRCLPFHASPRPIDGLDGDQQEAVKALLNSSDKVFVIEGKAGTGKTSLMRAAISQIEDAGQNVLTLAPTSQASHEVLKGEGFENSETIQQFLVNSRLQEAATGSTIWVDEAGLISIKEMRALCEIAQRQGSRLILAGDSSQHHSVERGDAFRMVSESGLVEVRQTRTIYRQRCNRHRQAVDYISTGDVARGFEVLDQMGAIKEASDFADQVHSVAAEYLQSMGKDRSVLVISPTHFEGRLITDEIRNLSRSNNLISGAQFVTTVHRSRNLTTAQRLDRRFVELGDVIKFHQNANGGFKRGSVWKVARWSDQGMEVVSAGEGPRVVTSAAVKHFQVFRSDSIELAVGDKVRITANTKSIDGVRLYNGSIFEITGWDQSGSVVLDRKHRLPFDCGILDYGYVTTSYSSQGRTVSKVIISQSSASAAAANSSQFYVCVSRSRDSVSIWTDDKEALLKSVERSDKRILATEVAMSALTDIGAEDPIISEEIGHSADDLSLTA